MSVVFNADGKDGNEAINGEDGTHGMDLHLVKKHGTSGTDSGKRGRTGVHA